MRRHINTEADENFCSKMLEGKKSYKILYCMQSPEDTGALFYPIEVHFQKCNLYSFVNICGFTKTFT